MLFWLFVSLRLGWGPPFFTGLSFGEVIFVGARVKGILLAWVPFPVVELLENNLCHPI